MAVVKVGFPFWLRPFLQRGVLAITLGRRVYVAREVSEADLPRVLRHELVHVRQIAELGVVRFYWRYLREYVANRRAGMPAGEAYRRISFEQEALIIEDSGRTERP